MEGFDNMTSDRSPGDARMPQFGVARVAAVLVALEGLALLGLAGWQVVELTAGDTGSAPTALALIVLTVVGAATVLAFAGAVAAGRSWGRAGGIVTQVLITGVAFGAVSGAYVDPPVAAALAVPAGVTFTLLLLLAARAAAPARRDDQTGNRDGDGA